MSESEKIDPLCCCEYFNRNNERYHILECCCNCVDLDQACDRLICCKSIESNNKTGMLLTFQDRLRIPWRGGAKQIQFSLDAIIPVVIIPLVLGIAAINFYCCVIMFIVTPGFLGYSYYYLRQALPRSRFFFMWTLWSIIYLILLFESTAPLLELLPEENWILIILICISIFCLYKTRQKAHTNIIVRSLGSNDDIPDITEEQTSILIDHEESDDHHPNICQNCHKYVPARTFHCSICQACILRQDHHSVWLDCCIGESNHRYYLSSLCFSLCALLWGINLALTSVCHPFMIFKVFGIRILLPDDCSEVFDEYELSLSFIVSIYALLIVVFVLIALIMQIYLISRGLTLSEWRIGRNSNRKSICWNWRIFLCWLN